jgi:putative SOS response-associated peptidase YedK
MGTLVRFRLISPNQENGFVSPARPGVFPDYPAPAIRNASAEREMVMMRWGMPPPHAHWRPTGNEHPQHVIAALTYVAQTGGPMLGPCQQLRQIRV